MLNGVKGRMSGMLLVSDMDGTLLDSRQQISAENREAIRRFQAEGGLFTLATGRTAVSVEPYVRELGIRIPLILYNGAQVYCPVRRQILHERMLDLDAEIWQGLMGAAGKSDAAILVYKDGGVFAPYRNALLERHERKDRVSSRPIEEIGGLHGITKLLIISAAPEKAIQLQGYVQGSGLPCETVFSESLYLEILPEQASKGEALKVLVRHLGIPGLQTMGIGNHLNDISLLQEADIGYAVANSHPLLLEAADEYTPHHEQHALADLIGRLQGRG